MKVALIFSGAEPGSAFAPYRARPFVDGLAQEGIDAIVIDVGGEIAPAATGANRRCTLSELPNLLTAERVDAVQTFGPAPAVGPVWSGARSVPIVHFVSAGGPVQDDEGLGFACARLRPRLGSVAGRRARFASRRVAAVIGSNRADIGRHIETGFFPRAAFSMLAPPPVAAGEGKLADTAASRPVFGVYDPHATAHVLSFVTRAVDLTGRPETFSVHIAPARLRILRAAPEAVSFVDPPDLGGFIGSIDALVLPYSEDRFVPTVLTALRARKIVIAPDGGIASELIEYGRHGVVYAAGSAYHLSMAINVVAQSWKNRPLDFAGVDAAIAHAAPQEVARTFAAAYRKLVA